MPNSTCWLQGVLLVGFGAAEVAELVWLRELVAVDITALPVRVNTSSGADVVPDAIELVVLEPSEVLPVPAELVREDITVGSMDPSPPPPPVKTRSPSSVVDCANICLLQRQAKSKS